MKRALIPLRCPPGEDLPSLSFDASILAGTIAASSQDMYQRDFLAYLAFAGTAEAALDASTLARWRTWLSSQTSLSPNTINRMLSAVRALMKQAAEQKLLDAEIAERFGQVAGVRVRALKERLKDTARTPIAPAQMRALSAAPDTSTLIGLRDAALLHTLASSGLRVAELASLTTAQLVERDRGYLLRVRGKNDEDYREAHLSVEAREAIERWRAARPVESKYLFTSFEGKGESRVTAKPMTVAAIWQAIQKYAHMVGLEHIKPHDFRRFVGTQLAKKDIRKAQRALGHKSIETTARHYVQDGLEVGLTDHLY
jgi:integrase/recombinase XerD